MSLIASAVIDEARDLHTSFNPFDIPDRVALRALSRYARSFAAKVVQSNEGALAVRGTIEHADVLTAAAAGTAITLPAHLRLLRPVKTTRSGVAMDVELFNYAISLDQDAVPWPYVYLLGGALRVPVWTEREGDPTTGWEDYGDLTYSYVPIPADLTAMSAEVPLPDTARDALVSNLALFFAGRRGATLSDLPRLPQQAVDAENAALASICASDNGARWMIARTRRM